MKMMQWRGDAVLGHLARKLVYEKSSGSEVPSQAMMAKWAQLSVSNASLVKLFDDVQIADLLHINGLHGKQKADRMEAVIFTLHQLTENARVAEWKVQLAKDTLESIMEVLLDIGWSRRSSDSCSKAGDPGANADKIRGWLKTFQCDAQDEYTHTSLRGCKDWTTESGRLNFPDNEEVRRELEDKIVQMFRISPLCYVEMATSSYPFFEDIDIMHIDAERSGDILLNEQFWLLRAQVLHDIFPTFDTLELTLFKAHGLQAEKQRYKESYHAIWRDLIVDKGRARLIRLATIARFNKESKLGGRVSELSKKLLEADEKNAWEAVFDITSVRCGSFRMPFCGKVYKGRIERPIEPEGVWRFSKVSMTRSIVDVASLPDVEWARRGRVRLFPNSGTTQLPPLTSWKLPNLSVTQKYKKSAAASSSMDTWQDRKAAKEKRITKRWEEEQIERRRLWKGTAIEFKAELDRRMEDENGYESMWIEIKAKTGCEKWSWTHRRLKGLIEFTQPSGEVFIRGSTTDQMVLLELLKPFTERYTGKVPKMSSATKKRLLPSRWLPARAKWRRYR